MDAADGLAASLARDGDPEPIHIKDIDTTVAVEWKGGCSRIDTRAFIYIDRKTGAAGACLDCPAQKLVRAARGG